ncbi:glycosyl hydrolase family 28-related protein [Caballeronia sp. LZ032]|uniref:glycosyl hydrolase family 28-related protein n=1 Tax=Caballeronia sp. LZ032 TaxID=3038565 RepID=UPI002861B3C3|nr:glycosyl hydrolase family 28-related protein [Caballeronia sp. LZ032]MDR5883629.1 glycosyl hydrolase family 28-related protein [Caballeronia sp. LZ032]
MVVRYVAIGLRCLSPFGNALAGALYMQARRLKHVQKKGTGLMEPGKQETHSDWTPDSPLPHRRNFLLAAGVGAAAIAGASRAGAQTSHAAGQVDIYHGMPPTDFAAPNALVADSISALRQASKSVYSRAFLTGYYGPHDGGGGVYEHDPKDTTSTENGGTIIVAADGGRWKLAFGGAVDVRQFGARGDGETDDTDAIQRATDALGRLGGGRLYFSQGTASTGGRFVISGVVVKVANVAWLGTGTPNGGLLVRQSIHIGQSGFSARHLDCQHSGPLNGTASNCFSVYSTDKSVPLSDFVFERCTFNGFFYAVDFLGCLDSLPIATASHTKNPIYNTQILFCKSTAPARQNAGHFQHQSVFGCAVMGCETYNGKNCASYNFTRDCRDIKVIGNFDANSAWGAVEIENSPKANAVVSGNTFTSTVTSQYAAIWVDDSAHVRVYGNVVQWLLKASCGNSIKSSSGLYPEEICAQTQVHFSNNICSHIQLGSFGTYVSGTVSADVKDNMIFGSGAHAILADRYYVGGEIDHNKATGALGNFAQLVRTPALRVFVRGNNSNGTPSAVSGSGGTIIAQDNDSIWSDQTETNLQGLNIAQGVIKIAPVTQSGIPAGGSAAFVFKTHEAVRRVSLTVFEFRCLCRAAVPLADDYVAFSVLVSNDNGTFVCNVSPLVKMLGNHASNFTVSASMSEATLAITVTNSHSAKLGAVQMFCENLMNL